MKKILITAFKKFGNFEINSTEEILKNFVYNNNDIIIYKDSFLYLKKQINIYHPDIIILTGMHKGATNIKLEQSAKNLLDFKIPDNNGLLIKNKKILDNGLECINTNFNIDDILRKINNPLVKKSNDAGSYLCNYIYYMSLNTFNDKDILFIHFPYLDEHFNLNDGCYFLESLINYIRGK
jgi:pyroglutamyl-peptidase